MNLSEKIDETFKAVHEIKGHLAGLIVHIEQHKEKLDTHEQKITVLDAYRNKTYGIIAVIGIFFGAIASWLVHTITTK